MSQVGEEEQLALSSQDEKNKWGDTVDDYAVESSNQAASWENQGAAKNLGPLIKYRILNVPEHIGQDELAIYLQYYDIAFDKLEKVEDRKYNIEVYEPSSQEFEKTLKECSFASNEEEYNFGFECLERDRLPSARNGRPNNEPYSREKHYGMGDRNPSLTKNRQFVNNGPHLRHCSNYSPNYQDPANYPRQYPGPNSLHDTRHNARYPNNPYQNESQGRGDGRVFPGPLRSDSFGQQNNYSDNRGHDFPRGDDFNREGFPKHPGHFNPHHPQGPPHPRFPPGPPARQPPPFLGHNTTPHNAPPHNAPPHNAPKTQNWAPKVKDDSCYSSGASPSTVSVGKKDSDMETVPLKAPLDSQINQSIAQPILNQSSNIVPEYKSPTPSPPPPPPPPSTHSMPSTLPVPSQVPNQGPLEKARGEILKPAIASGFGDNSTASKEDTSHVNLRPQTKGNDKSLPLNYHQNRQTQEPQPTTNEPKESPRQPRGMSRMDSGESLNQHDLDSRPGKGHDTAGRGGGRKGGRRGGRGSNNFQAYESEEKNSDRGVVGKGGKGGRYNEEEGRFERPESSKRFWNNNRGNQAGGGENQGRFRSETLKESDASAFNRISNHPSNTGEADSRKPFDRESGDNVSKSSSNDAHRPYSDAENVGSRSKGVETHSKNDSKVKVSATFGYAANAFKQMNLVKKDQSMGGGQNIAANTNKSANGSGGENSSNIGFPGDPNNPAISNPTNFANASPPTSVNDISSAKDSTTSTARPHTKNNSYRSNKHANRHGSATNLKTPMENAPESNLNVLPANSSSNNFPAGQSSGRKGNKGMSGQREESSKISMDEKGLQGEQQTVLTNARDTAVDKVNKRSQSKTSGPSRTEENVTNTKEGVGNVPKQPEVVDKNKKNKKELKKGKSTATNTTTNSTTNSFSLLSINGE